MWILPHAPAGRSSPCTPGTSATCQKDSAVGHIGRIGHIGRRLRRRTPPNQSMACEARHAPSGPRAGRAPCAHARPAPCVVLFVSLAVEGLSLRACTVSFVISKDTLAVLRALARRPPLCPSVLSVLLCVLRNLRFPLHRASCIFVVLREPSCQPRRVNLPHSPSGSIRRALVARPVAVEGLALRACTLCSLFFGRR